MPVRRYLLRANGALSGVRLCVPAMPVCLCLAHTVANRASVSCWSSCVCAVPTPRLVFSESALGHFVVGVHCRALFTRFVRGPGDGAGAPVISRRLTRPAQWHLCSLSRWGVHAESHFGSNSRVRRPASRLNRSREVLVCTLPVVGPGQYTLLHFTPSS